jgi:hypothetical protein
MVRNMGFPCAHVTIHFQVHVSAAIAFSRIEGTFSPKKEKVRWKESRKLKQDWFDPNKFIVPFDCTDAEQCNLQKPETMQSYPNLKNNRPAYSPSVVQFKKLHWYNFDFCIKS